MRLAVPDYRFDVYYDRSVKSDIGEILFDPGGGGKFANGVVSDGGHLWFPKIELIRELFSKSNFEDSKVTYFHYYDETGISITQPIDYAKGFIARTPDNDSRAQNPYRAMSIVVDVIK